MQIESVEVSAPFKMAPLRVPDFSQCKIFNIADYGAQKGISEQVKEANQAAIAKAISLAYEANGGTVLIPEGTWFCAKIHLKSFVNLHVSEHAILLFSSKPEDYMPAVPSSWEGMECYNYSPLIYAFQCQHVSLSGSGTLRALMNTWQDWSERPEPHMNALAELYHKVAKYEPVSTRQMAFYGANLRPQFVQFNRCEHVLVEDIHIEHSPFWVLHPFLCKDVIIRRVNINAHGHNSDGIDPEMSQNMLIEDCVFDQGDDAIAIKAGRNQDGWRLNVTTRNVVIRRCHIKCAHHLIVIGSELSAGVENIFVTDCQFDGQTAYKDAGNVLYIKTNDRCGGLIQKVYVQNIQAKRLAGAPLVIETDVLYQWRHLVPSYETRLTKIQLINMSNIMAHSSAHLCRIDGQREMSISKIELIGFDIKNVSGAEVLNNNVEKFVLT